jgi:8-oxo-dGTP pyrophosphatase MutT (NUDIX family)
VDVVAAVIERDGRLLVCQRPTGGQWEFPGGKLEPRETLLTAAQRELAEELDVCVTSVGSVRLVLHDPGSEFVIKFVEVEIDGEPRSIEHVDLA